MYQISNLFLAKTSDSYFFKKKFRKNNLSKLREIKEQDLKNAKKMDKRFQKMLLNHHIINFSRLQKCQLFCLNISSQVLPCFDSWCLTSRTNRRLWTIFSEGTSRMRERTDTLEHLRAMSTLEVFLRRKLLTSRLKTLINNDPYNVIEVSSSDTQMQNLGNAHHQNQTELTKIDFLQEELDGSPQDVASEEDPVEYLKSL